MNEVISWAEFAGAWLLVAGPVRMSGDQRRPVGAEPASAAEQR